MSDDRTTVKDLAVKLGVSAKDVLRVLRDLDIQAKSTVSIISNNDLEKVKARFAVGQTDSDQRREINPGVIVRRRRQNEVSEQIAESALTEEKPEPVKESPVLNASDIKSSDPKSVESKPVEAKASEVKAAGARIIHRPSDEVDKVEIASASAEKAEVSVTEPVSAPVLAEPTPVVSEPVVQPVVAEADKADKPKPRPSKKETRAQLSQPARIITTPSKAEPVKPEPEIIAPVAVQAVEKIEVSPVAEQDAKPRKQPSASAMPEGSSAPSLLPPPGQESRRDSELGETGEDRERRRKKKRPEPIATPQVRIISRPDPAQIAARAASEARPDNRDNRGTDRPDNRSPRPDNRPGGDYRPRPSGPGGDNRGPRPGGPGADNRGPRPGGAGGPGGDNRPRPSGPGGPRPSGPGGPRPSGPGGRPDNRDAGRPDNRPPAPRGPRPLRPGETGAPPVIYDAHRKKKRNKNKRPGDGDFVTTRRIDDDSDMPKMRSGRRRSKAKERNQPQVTQPLKAAKRKLKIEEAIRVADMAHQMGLKSSEIIKVLFNLGIMATINMALDVETATIVAAEFGYEVEKVGFAEEDYLVPVAVDNPEEMKLRPPVVTIMGHVDHGKTSLLDAIRKTNVTGGEAGGITQHIGAYHVKTKRGEIVFLDTPGHEAFTAMRARGAQVTDLVVLVVAADDGVMEQTREAINHAKAANVPIMVAVNKMDKPEANPDRVLRELAELGLQSESWGGDTVTAMVSAKTRMGLDDLLELIALQAELLDLKANPIKPARGHIVEAKLDKGRGPVATVLIQEGTLKQGDTFVCGVFSGKVRAMFNDQGRKVKEAGPSMPVEVQGFDGVPEAGEEFICLTDEKLARRIAEARAIKQRERVLAKESRVTLETFLLRKPDAKEAQVLNLVMKADVQGSLEAITEAVRKLTTEKVRINVIHGGAGTITESDILLATASEAIVIGFNVRPTAKVKEMAEQEHVDIRFYDIIYKLVDEIRSAMTGMLAPVQKEVYLGQADVRNTFSVPKIGIISGSHVSDGKITRNAGARLLRDGVVVYTGKIGSLRRFKDDVKEVLKGYECGISLENFGDIKVGDVIEAFEMINEAATL